MNRRTLLAGFVAGAAGLILPGGVSENAETARRWWSLGAVPGRDPRIIDMWEQDFIQSPPSTLLWVTMDPALPDRDPRVGFWIHADRRWELRYDWNDV